jgi:hypothetical protein
MAIQFSTTLRNNRLDQITSTIGNAALLQLYDGTPPASCAAALSSNNQLVSETCGSPLASASSVGVLTLNSISVITASASGTASFFRIMNSSNTTCHMQGTVTVTGGSGDMTLNTTYLTIGGNVTVTSFSLTEANA